MVRIPTFSRRAEEPTRDENGDGRIDERDARPVGAAPVPATAEPRAGDPVASYRAEEPTTYRSRSAAAVADSPTATAEPVTSTEPARPRTGLTKSDVRDMPPPPPVTDRREAQRAGRADVEAERLRADQPEMGGPVTAPDVADAPETPVVPAGPRPRASVLATVSLMLGVAGILSVLTGALAGYGIAVGAVGALLGVAGISATSRRHVAGKTDALIGLLLGLAAVVIGILAMTGQFTWPSTDGDTVVRFREWLDTQFIDRF